MQILWRFGCGLFLLTSIHIIITRLLFIFIWPALCVCVTGTSPWQKTSHSPILRPLPSPGTLAPSPGPTGFLWGGDNCVMVCSLSGSGQATGVFSQSRHLLCSAAVFSSDVMSCGRSRPCNPRWIGRTGEGRGGAVIRACGGGDWIRGLYLSGQKNHICCYWGQKNNNAASRKLVSVPCKNLTFTVNFTLSVSDLEDAWK